jgi:hypothetical protein
VGTICLISKTSPFPLFWLLLQQISSDGPNRSPVWFPPIGQAPQRAKQRFAADYTRKRAILRAG